MKTNHTAKQIGYSLFYPTTAYVLVMGYPAWLFIPYKNFNH